MGRQSVAWREWGPRAFEEARSGGRLLFLLIRDSWSQASADAQRLVSEDSALSALLDSTFVPVLSDADAEPDIFCRYGGPAVPCACVLHADGAIVRTFESVDAKELQAALSKIGSSVPASETVRRRGLGLYPVPFLPSDDRNLERGTEALETIRRRLEDCLEPVGAAFKGRSGESGTVPLRFLLEYAKGVGEENLLRKVVEWLHTLAHSELYDSVEGGFFTRRQELSTGTDKRLRANAHWLEFALAIAGEPGGRFALPLARGILHYLQTRLLLPGGAFAAGQREDPGYYGLSADERRHVVPPPLNDTVYAAGNAAAIRALCVAWQELGEKAYLDLALGAHEFVRDHLVAPDGSVAHAYKDGPRGIGYLEDELAVGSSLLALYRSTLAPAFLESLRESARNVVSSYRNPAGAGLLDLRTRSGAGGLPWAPKLDPLLNARAAVFLARASAQLDDPSLAAPARSILAALLGEMDQDADTLGYVGLALTASLHPMAYFVAVTDGTEAQRAMVVEKIRTFGKPFPMILHGVPSPEDRGLALPRLTAHCGNRRDVIPVP